LLVKPVPRLATPLQCGEGETRRRAPWSHRMYVRRDLVADEFSCCAPLVQKWRVLALACAGMLLAASPAFADVIEIGADGAITRIGGPVIVNDAGTAPIAAPRTPHPGLAPLAPRFAAAGGHTQLSPRLLEAVAWAESRFNQSARSRAGAQGVMQLMPGTAASLGFNARDVDQNVRGGAAYLRQMLDLFGNDLVLALAAYNAGPDAVRRYGGVPPYPETQAYVAAVLAYLADAAKEDAP